MGAASKRAAWRALRPVAAFRLRGGEDASDEEAEEATDDGADWDRDQLRKLYEESSRQFPDVRFQQMREEERRLRREAEFWPRGAMVLLAHGVDEVDVAVVTATLREANVGVELVSLHQGLRVEGRAGMALEANRTLDEVPRVLSVSGLVLPGGNDSYVSTASSDRRVSVLAQAYAARQRLCCALGAGVHVLRATGVLYGRAYIKPPSVEEEAEEEAARAWRVEADGDPAWAEEEAAVRVDGHCLTALGRCPPPRPAAPARRAAAADRRAGDGAQAGARRWSARLRSWSCTRAGKRRRWRRDACAGRACPRSSGRCRL